MPFSLTGPFMVWGASPQSAGREVVGNYFYLGQCPEVVAGKANITSLYTAKFGAPVAGQNIFIRSKQMSNGYCDIFHGWSDIVPAAS